MKLRNYVMAFAVLAAYSGLAFAVASGGSAINSALCQIKDLVTTVLPTLALVMFFLAGLAYAAGQIFGAETKARAQGYAMSLIIGGIVGILLAVMAPTLVDAFAGSLGGGGASCP